MRFLSCNSFSSRPSVSIVCGQIFQWQNVKASIAAESQNVVHMPTIKFHGAVKAATHAAPPNLGGKVRRLLYIHPVCFSVACFLVLPPVEHKLPMLLRTYV